MHSHTYVFNYFRSYNSYSSCMFMCYLSREKVSVCECNFRHFDIVVSSLLEPYRHVLWRHRYMQGILMFMIIPHILWLENKYHISICTVKIVLHYHFTDYIAIYWWILKTMNLLFWCFCMYGCWYIVKLNLSLTGLKHVLYSFFYLHF